MGGARKRLLDSTCIVYFHGSDWDAVRARQQYLMKALASHFPIYYLDQGTDRIGASSWQRVDSRITVNRGLVRLVSSLERRRLMSVAKLYARWKVRHIRKRFKNIILWSADNWFQPHRYVPHDFLVFDCMDPCFAHDAATLKAYDTRELQMLKRAQLVFASADALYEKCLRHNTQTVMLRNACEPSEYSDTLVEAAPIPSWWPHRRNPVASYLGSVDWRVDFACVREACERNPNVDFIIAGNVGADVSGEASRLRNLGNVTIPGRISTEEGRYLLKHSTVGLIPFSAGKMNDAVNPVKMYAYALMGKPILGTTVRELCLQSSIVHVAASAREYAGLIPKAISLANDRHHQQKLVEFAMSNTWQHRALTAVEAIRALGGSN